MGKRFYITTAIDYLNGQPHLGHAYEKIVSDVIARARRSLGAEVFFLTGLDEHGQKVQQAALKEGKTPQAYCDELAGDWKAFAAKLDISNDDFIRTTEARHKVVVQAILDRLNAGGHLYRALYKGFYSTREETFLTDKDRRADGTFDPAFGEVIELAEENYYFKLKAHQPWLIDYIEANPSFISPSYRRNEVLGFLKNNQLEDLCISRPAARLNWGIPIPFDPSFVTYVWFDALVNYLTVPVALGDAVLDTARPSALALWPADLHVIGKDILKFHAVYWPAFLMSAGLAVPRRVFSHGFLFNRGEKISKSVGNVIDPFELADAYGVDPLRYFFLP